MNFTKLHKTYFEIIFNKIPNVVYILAKTNSVFGSQTKS